MKRAVRYALVFLCIFLCFFAFSCKSDKDIGGNVTDAPTQSADETTAAVVEKVTYTVPTKKFKGDRLLYEYSYSPDGLSMSKTDYTEETPITYTVTFGEDGRPISTEWTVAVNEERSELWRDSYDEFDEAGNITLERRYCEGQIENAFAYTYNEAGDIETQTTRNVKQENITYRLLYDEAGTHTGTRFKKYNGDSGYYSEEKEFTYDGEGRILSEKSPSYTVKHEYKLTEGFVTREKITNESDDGELLWCYYYQYSYENAKLVKKDCSFEGTVIENEEFSETEFLHYSHAVNWIFRERLP